MRKISQQARYCFEYGHTFNQSNTSVKVEQDGSTCLYLHGNLIAKRTSDGLLYVTSAGWTTNTTKERLNALSGVSISQKAFIWYLNGHEWTENDKLTCVNTWPNPNPTPTSYKLDPLTLN